MSIPVKDLPERLDMPFGLPSGKVVRLDVPEVLDDDDAVFLRETLNRWLEIHFEMGTQ